MEKIINENKPFCISNAFNTLSSIYFQNVIKDKKGCRRFYDTMVGASELMIVNKWEREIGYIPEEDLLSYNAVIKDLREIALSLKTFSLNLQIKS